MAADFEARNAVPANANGSSVQARSNRAASLPGRPPVDAFRARVDREPPRPPGAGPSEAPERRHDPARLDVQDRREHLPGTGVVDGKDEIVVDLGVHEPGQGLGILGYRVPAAHADGLYRPRMPVVGHEGMTAVSGQVRQAPSSRALRVSAQGLT